MTPSATEPTVPLRLEFTVDVPGTPEQVWDAIATAKGNSSWFIRTEMEEREGGAVAFHMGEGEDMISRGRVTGYDAPRRLEYEEPGWAKLAGHPDATVSPMVTEMIVEARSGGTCVVRVVTSAFGTGADWEREFFDEMVKNWQPMFDHLRLYLTHFPGQHATPLSAEAPLPGTAADIRAVMWPALGVKSDGEAFEMLGVKGQVEQYGEFKIVVRLTDPIPGFLVFYAYDVAPRALAAVAGYLFSPQAPPYVERELPSWTKWLENLPVPAA